MFNTTPTPALRSELPDITRVRQAIAHGETDAPTQLEGCIAHAQSPQCEHVFVSTDFAHARQQLLHTWPAQPLAGLAVSVKDLFDVAGQTTAAGSQILAQNPPALADCPAVARLKAAGGVVIGRTNMVEFAFSGVGTNPHFGTPVNPCDPAVARIPGGSSSGAAVSVAIGAAFAALGSDTGGSIRIPAALCGVVGFKSTARLVPTLGAVPLSSTLDTVCAITRSVQDATLVHEILSQRPVTRGNAGLAHYRLAVARSTMLEDLEPAVAHAFDRALGRLRAAGARIVEIELSEIADLGKIQARGGFSAAEALAWHRARGLWPQQRDRYDPRVAQRIAWGEGMGAADYIGLCAARQDWIARTERALAGFDAVLSPTVPITAPSIASLAPANGTDRAADADAARDAARDAEFFRINGLLLRNTSVVNMLDGCAISIPCHARGELPVGLMLWHGAMHDNTVLAVALQAETALVGL